MDIRLHPQKRVTLIIQSSFLSLLRQPSPEGLLSRPRWAVFLCSDSAATAGLSANLI